MSIYYKMSLLHYALPYIKMLSELSFTQLHRTDCWTVYQGGNSLSSL